MPRLTVRNPLLGICGFRPFPNPKTVLEAGTLCMTPRVNCAEHEEWRNSQ